MLPLLLLAFIVVPIAELTVIISVGQWLGVLPTVGLLVASAVAGSAMMRWQGRAAWRAFTAAVQAGRPPAREVIDGALVLLGGALLLTPGFLTDFVGLAFLAPPTRAVIRRVLARRLVARMTAQMSAAARRRVPVRDYDVEGTARDIDGSARIDRP